jgi:DNA-binding MarR family transcriptional regulator
MLTHVNLRDMRGTEAGVTADPAEESEADAELVRRWHELAALKAAIAGDLDRELGGRHGISGHEFEALERLAVSGRSECRAQELTEALVLSQSASSRLIARLEKQGLVSRGMCDVDRRGVFVCLTPAGEQRYREARPTQRAVLAAHL